MNIYRDIIKPKKVLKGKRLTHFEKRKLLNILSNLNYYINKRKKLQNQQRNLHEHIRHYTTYINDSIKELKEFDINVDKSGDVK